MFKIITYINRSDNNYLNKNLEFIKELEGDFRYENSILTPSVDIEGEINFNFNYDISYDDGDICYDMDGIETDVQYNTDSLITNINYIYIPLLNKYYYVNDVVLISNKMFRFSCTVDVLMSYKRDILMLHGLVERNEFEYDSTLEDNSQYFEFKNDVVTIDADKSLNTFEFNQMSNQSELTYYISYMDKYADNVSTDYSNKVENNLPQISNNMAGYSKFITGGVMIQSFVGWLCSNIIDKENLASYITSLIAYPFIIPHKNELKDLILASEGVPTIVSKYYEPKKDLSDYYLLGRFTLAKEDFTDVEPYSTYELYLPFVDFVTLKSSDILDCEIRIYYVFDFPSGTAKAIVYNHTKDYMIASYNATVGIKIPVNRTNAQEINDAKAQTGINIATSTLAGVVGGALKGGVVGAIIGGVAGATISTIKGVETLAFMHEKAQASVRSGFEGVYSPLDIFIKVTKYQKRDVTNYNHLYGKPLNEYKLLNTLSGFTRISEIHLDNFDATNTEKDLLLQYLKEGIII